MIDALGSTVVGCILVPVVAVAAAALLRWARAPGANVLGGALAGVLLGPTLFGRVMPDAYESALVGGVEERVALDDLEHARHRDLTVATSVGRDDTVLREIEQRHEPAITAARTAWRDRRWSDQRPFRGMTVTLAAVALLLAGTATGRRTGPSPGLVVPLSIGAGAAALPGVAVFIVLHHLLALPALESALAAAAVAIGPGGRDRGDDDAAGAAELGGARLLARAGRISSVMAIAAAATAFVVRGGPTVLPAVVALSALWIGWLLPPGGAVRQRWIDRILLPVVAAVAVVRVDLYEHVALWPIVIIVVAGADGRWLGATLGAVVLGRRGVLRTLRLTVGAMACTPTQLAVVAIGAGTWFLTEPVILALVLGAVVNEMTAPMRHAAAARIRHLETELEDMDGRGGEE